MKNIFCLGIVSATVLVAGCSAFRAGSQFQAGRQDLLIGNSASAADHFQEAAKLDPNYEKPIGYMREGVWTYLGRADYDAGKLPAARQALERALARNDKDYLASLYLGLVLAKTGNQDQSGTVLKRGLEGLDEWFTFTRSNVEYGAYWDPSGLIRSKIRSDLAMLSRTDTDWPKLIATSEWIGKNTEEEIDLVRRDERQRYDDDDVDGHGQRRH